MLKWSVVFLLAGPITGLFLWRMVVAWQRKQWPLAILYAVSIVFTYLVLGELFNVEIKFINTHLQ